VVGPCPSPSRLPRFSTAPGGSVLLSWIEESRATDSEPSAALRFALKSVDGWSAPLDIAAGENWFVNWADFPAVSMLDSRRGLAHYLARSAGGTYDYNVQFVQTVDGGQSWSTAARLHSDPGLGEHGFVSLLALDSDHSAAVWLDGRSTREDLDATGHGSMSLYTRTIRYDGELGPEVLLDERVCDCCPTAAARTKDGLLLVAYRDRSADEVRDIQLLRLAPGGVPVPIWSSGDGWKIAGCPVNGPVLAVSGERVAIAWFSMGSEGLARVQVALSKDSGRSFRAPLTLAEGNNQGRVDAVFDDSGRLIVVWLADQGESAEWRVARIDRAENLIDEHAIVATSAGRESGMARLAWESGGALFTFTDQVDGRPRVALRRLSWQ